MSHKKDNIISIFRKIPAGIMMIPMLAGIFINTFIPEAIAIGGFTTAVFSAEGAAGFMGLQLLCMGSQLKVRDLKTVVRKGSVILLSKVVLGLICIGVVSGILGREEIFGVTLLALVCSITNINGSIYISLSATYGDESDGAIATFLSLTNGPFLVMILYGMTGLSSFSIMSLVASTFPIALGFLLGNISEAIREFLKPGIRLLLPFIGFTLGASMKLTDVIEGGLSGFIVAFISLGLGIICCYLFDKYLGKGTGLAGIAASATGANAIGIPAALALVNDSYLTNMKLATMQITTAVILSAVVVPILVGMMRKDAVP